MQIAGNPCFVCSRTISLMREGAGCVSCRSVFHKNCLQQEGVCPHCGRSLLPTEQVHATPAGPSHLAGINGWLIPWAVGFAVGPVIIVIMFFRAADLFPAVEAAGYAGIYTLDLLLEAGLLVLLIYAATRFVRMKTDAPVVIISLLIASMGMSAVLLVAAVVAHAAPFVTEGARDLGRAVIQAAIWIPYWRVSKRVKATFVN